MIPRARVLSTKKRSSFSLMEDSNVSVNEIIGLSMGLLSKFYFIINIISLKGK